MPTAVDKTDKTVVFWGFVILGRGLSSASKAGLVLYSSRGLAWPGVRQTHVHDLLAL